MNQAKLAENLIYKHPKVILEKLWDSKTLPYSILIKFKRLYDYHHVYIGSSYDNIKDAPEGYFKVSLNEEKLEEVKLNLINRYNGIISKYWTNDLFLPIGQLENLLEAYKDIGTFAAFTFPRFTAEKNIIWNRNLLRKYRMISRHCSLFKETNLKWDFDLMEEFKNEITWDDVIHFKDLVWDINKLVKYKDYLTFKNNDSNWDRRTRSFSSSKNINWSFEIIDSLKDYWDWEELSSNDSIKWNEDLIEKFIDKIDFSKLSTNRSVQWSLSLLNKYERKLDWENLSGNPGLPWSLNLLRKYEQKWNWRPRYDWYTDDECNYLPSVSTNTAILWDVETLEYCKERIDFWRIARMGNISYESLKKFNNEFYRSELIGWKHHDYSDFMTVSEKLYLTGWQNLSLNEQFKITEENIEFLRANFIELTLAEGNLAEHGRDSGEYVTKQFKLIEIFKNSKFSDSEFLNSVLESQIYKSFFINDTFINNEIWESLIKPIIKMKPSEILQNLYHKIMP